MQRILYKYKSVGIKYGTDYQFEFFKKAFIVSCNPSKLSTAYCPFTYEFLNN